MSSLGIWVFALPSIRQTWQILHFQWRLSWPNYDMENILMIRYRPLSFHLLQAKAGLLHRQKYFCKHLWQQHLVASPTLKGLNMDKVKTNSNQKHTKSSLSHNNSTCYFSSSVLRGRCWSWWPRVKIGLKWMCLIALNNPDNTCWLGSILIGKIFLKIIVIQKWETIPHKNMDDLPLLFELYFSSPRAEYDGLPKWKPRNHSPKYSIYHFPRWIL